jgi:mannose-1-phosphate guanylyltransferase
MTIKDSFILCAGKGSRMGPIGQVLAKPVWPLFDKTLLEIQVDFLKEIGCTNFNVNSHHLHKQVEHVCSSLKENPNVFFEEKLLGSGGCFHNLKKENGHLNKVIILNSDIQIFLSDVDRKDLLQTFNDHDFVMVCLPVERGGLYNEVCCDQDGFFSGIKPPNQKTDYVTYSGFGMVNLALVKYVDGESSFFETIINKEINKTKIFTPSDPYEYWDWGTKELYVSNIKKLSSETTKSKLTKFLIETNSLNQKKIGADGYNSNGGDVFNFSNVENVSDYNNVVVMSADGRVVLLPI